VSDLACSSQYTEIGRSSNGGTLSLYRIEPQLQPPLAVNG